MSFGRYSTVIALLVCIAAGQVADENDINFSFKCKICEGVAEEIEKHISKGQCNYVKKFCKEIGIISQKYKKRCLDVINDICGKTKLTPKQICHKIIPKC